MKILCHENLELYGRSGRHKFEYTHVQHSIARNDLRIRLPDRVYTRTIEQGNFVVVKENRLFGSRVNSISLRTTPCINVPYTHLDDHHALVGENFCEVKPNHSFYNFWSIFFWLPTNRLGNGNIQKIYFFPSYD